MLSIFIGFGGTKAEEVAKKLESFLRNETKMETFLASPLSRTLSASSADYGAKITQSLIDCHVAVFVCHKYSPRSEPLKNEIDLLFSRNFENKIILFSASDNCIPSKFRAKLWNPLHFPPEKPEESFCRLVNEIYRCYIERQESARIVTEDTELIEQ
jgi:hypothetical protein